MRGWLSKKREVHSRLRLEVANTYQRELADKLTILSASAVEGALADTIRLHATALASHTPETHAFVCMYESLTLHCGCNALSPEQALDACQKFLRGGAALSSDEILLIQRRAKDWYRAWDAAQKTLPSQVALAMSEFMDTEARVSE